MRSTRYCPKCGRPYLRDQRRHLGTSLPTTLFVHRDQTLYFPGFGHLTIPVEACKAVEALPNPFEEVPDGSPA